MPAVISSGHGGTAFILNLALPSILPLLVENPFVFLVPSALALLSGVVALDARSTQYAFRQEHAGRVFLLAATTKGWREFNQNNLVPILSPDVTICWPRTSEAKLVRHGMALQGLSAQAPALVLAHRDRIEVIRLHAKLLPMRKKGARSKAVQQAVGRIVALALRAVLE